MIIKNGDEVCVNGQVPFQGSINPLVPEFLFKF